MLVATLQINGNFIKITIGITFIRERSSAVAKMFRIVCTFSEVFMWTLFPTWAKSSAIGGSRKMRYPPIVFWLA